MGALMKHEEKYTELLDLRTHLTVAILASSQLKRKGPKADELLRLHSYLDQSLAQLQDDITSLESLVDRLDDDLPPPVARRRRLPTHWIGMAAIFLASKLRQCWQPARPRVITMRQALTHSPLAS